MNITLFKVNNFLQDNSIINQTYNYMLITPKYGINESNKKYGVIGSNIIAKPGVYIVNIVVNTLYDLEWWGDYNNSYIQNIKNGSNTFYIKIEDNQKEEFSVGIYNNKNINSTFMIYDFSIIKKKKKYDDNNSSSLVNIFHKFEDYIFGYDCDDYKKNILLIIDYQNGTFYNIVSMIKKYLGQKFNIFVDAYINLPDYKNKYKGIKIDMVIKFWYEHYCTDPFDIFTKAKKVLCIYDYIYWNSDINKNNADKYKKILDENINKIDFILYSCPIIKNLLIKNYGSRINRKLFPVFDGYDPTLFYYYKYNNNTKLIVGWVGNSLNIYKKLDTLKEIIKNKNWIELKIQDKNNNPIPQNKMLNFYRNVDVVVCLSTAEGTPNPILEASACGRAWISTDVGIVSILNNITTTTIKPGFIIKNESELLEKLEILYKNRQIMKEMGLIGSMCCKKNFTWENQIKQFEKIFDLI